MISTGLISSCRTFGCVRTISNVSLVLRHMTYTLCSMAVLLPVLFLSGCESQGISRLAPDYYYLDSQRDMRALGRVAIVEVQNDSSYPEISGDVTEALFQAVQKKQLFGLTLVWRQGPEWRRLQLDPRSAYTIHDLSALRRTLRCNAMLTGTITQYQPYPHMVMGLRLKLVDLRDGQLLWGVEQIWDGSDKATEKRIRDYFRTQMRSGFAPLHEELLTVSPLRFREFVAYEVAETLQAK